MKKWTHIIADLYGCDIQNRMADKPISDIESELSKLVKESWLTELWNFYHEFWKHAFTAAIVLAESHMTLHTRPEDKYISLDIFVCNYTQDQKKAAFFLYENIKQLVKPLDIKENIIDR